jgi:hypothetical protein
MMLRFFSARDTCPVIRQVPGSVERIVREADEVSKVRHIEYVLILPGLVPTFLTEQVAVERRFSPF